MLETLKKEWEAKIILGLFLLYVAWWVYMQVALPHDHILYALYGQSYGVIALVGGIWGLFVARKWGGFKSVMGKAIIMFSLGLFAQEFGQMAYTYYIFIEHIEIPYPSIGDIGFFGTIPFYIYGAYLLAKASGVKISLRSFGNKLQAILIPVVMVGVSYILFLRNYQLDFSHPLKSFLDFGYPLGQAIYVSIAIFTYVATRKLLGGIMRPKILVILFAFVAQFLSDYSFIYFQDKYYPGHFIDLVYTASYMIMAIGILELKTVYNQLHRG